MRKPTIHLNGTSRQRLLDDLTAAADAMREAHRAVCNASPNARDYYPQGSDAFGAADDEHRARLARLESVLAELNELTVHVYEAQR